jgi:CheY-like chemotaxis protein
MTINRVLIVDDDEAIRELLQIFFEDTWPSCRIVKARNGYEALAEMEHKPFDLAVVDFQMPGMNGLELATVARQIAPAMKLMLISGSRPQTISQAINQGIFDDYLDKPFTLEEFVAKIGQIEPRPEWAS